MFSSLNKNIKWKTWELNKKLRLTDYKQLDNTLMLNQKQLRSI